MAEPVRVWTVEAFLAWERQQKERYEFVDGIVRAMVGGSLNRNRVIVSVVSTLDRQLADGPCEVFVDGAKVVAAENVFYPDVVVSCHDAEGDSDIAPDPVAIIEVLSPTTSNWDRERKWPIYRNIPSLRYFVMIFQDERRVEMWRRSNHLWEFTVVTGGSGRIDLPGIGCSLTLDEIYRRTGLAAPSGAG